jgi:hypothetical protein
MMADANFPITFSLKHSIAEINNALNVADAIKTALSPDATPAQRADIENLIGVLEAAQAELTKPACPNGMMYQFTITASQLAKIGQAQG